MVFTVFGLFPTVFGAVLTVFRIVGRMSVHESNTEQMIHACAYGSSCYVTCIALSVCKFVCVAATQ